MSHIDIVFDGPPGPVAGRFVEVEDASGKSINAGEWVQRADGYWALRIAQPSPTASEKRLEEATEIIEDGASSGYIGGCDMDIKWHNRRTAFLAKGETK